MRFNVVFQFVMHLLINWSLIYVHFFVIFWCLEVSGVTFSLLLEPRGSLDCGCGTRTVKDHDGIAYFTKHRSDMNSLGVFNVSLGRSP